MKLLKKLKSPHLWVSSTYFAEGYPYSIVNNIPELLFKELGASLEAIGLTSLFHLPWNIKFLWAPYLDQYFTKRKWTIALEVVMAVIVFLMALVLGWGQSVMPLAVGFLILAFLSATHDVAIDAFYLEGLNARDQSKFVGYRAMAYRVAGMVLSGPIVILIGLTDWKVGFLVMSAGLALLIAIHVSILPKVEKQKHGIKELSKLFLRKNFLIFLFILSALLVAHQLSGFGKNINAKWLNPTFISQWVTVALLAILFLLLAFLPYIKRLLGRKNSPYAIAFVDFLSQDRVGLILLFVVLFRAGESFLTKMRWPFLRDSMGMSLEGYGFANGTVGVFAGFVATLLGGWLISKHGLKRWIWPFVLAQNGLNLLFMALAHFSNEPWARGPLTSLVIAIDQFGSGLGTAVFLVYIIRCCDPRHKAAHMAILTALMSVSFTIAGVASGVLATSMGYTAYFGFTFLATLPSMALIGLIPYVDRPRST